MNFVAAALVLAFTATAAADEPSRQGTPAEPRTPSVPPASGSLSSDLNRSGGVIKPPTGIDPEIKQAPPQTGAKMPVIPPPGTPGGNPEIQPK